MKPVPQRFYLVPALLASPFSLIYGVGWDIHDFITRVGSFYLGPTFELGEVGTPDPPPKVMSSFFQVVVRIARCVRKLFSECKA